MAGTFSFTMDFHVWDLAAVAGWVLVSVFFIKWCSPDAKIARKPYVLWILGMVGVYLVMYLVAMSLEYNSLTRTVFYTHLFMLWVVVFLSVRRAQDAGVNKWVCALLIVPVFTILVVPILMLKKTRQSP